MPDMVEIIGVRFKEVGKIYYFDPDSLKMEKEQKVIVETSRGVECGSVAVANRQVPQETIAKPLKKVIRAATEEDIVRLNENKQKEEAAFEVCLQKIEKHGLVMKLVEAEYTFDRSKLIFYFTSDGRVDFRELVRDLASHFKTRIELRQIGVRDEAKKLGGFGICGRPFCCNTFLGEFHPVSIKMAKEQGLSLSPTKISGSCGRLMCCLKYEQNAYEYLLKITPKPGAIVSTPSGKGVVVEANTITGMLKISIESHKGAPPVLFHRKQVKLVKDAQIKVEKEELDALKNIE